MQRYAAWKAADIRKAVREGRAPTPGPPGGGDGAGGSGSLDLPSPPGDDLPAPPPPSNKPATIPRSESDVGGGGGVAAPPRHAPGAAVVYCHDGFPPAVAGTVAKVNPPEGLGVTYVVALADQVVSAFEAQLAPALEPGAEVVVKADEGASDAPPPGDYVVQAVDTSVWRPRYTLEPKGGGGTTVTVDDGVLASWPPPRGRAPKPPKQPPPFAAPHPPAGSVEPPSAPPSAPPAPEVAAPAAPAASAPAAPLPQPSIKAMQDAIKASKSAISSLQFEDVPTAVKYLTEALELLGRKG